MTSGHTQQDAVQARPTGSRPLAPIPFDVETVFPELTGMSREVTLLYPRAGQPGPGDSSIGGPLLWPADEPWPMCTEPDHYKPLDTPVGPEPVAMVPVIQLYARDVPELDAPAVDRSVGDDDAALEHQFPHLAERQRKAEVQPHAGEMTSTR